MTEDSISMFNRFRLQPKLRPQNYPIQNRFLQRLGNATFRVGVATLQGFRDAMEDAHCTILSLENHPDVALFGVFDGHSGTEVSRYTAKHLPPFLDALETFSKESLTERILAFDKKMIAELPAADGQGTTAVFCLVTKDGTDEQKPWLVQVLNLGDSRLIVGHYVDASLEQISKDHKPQDEAETERIKAAGGIVARNRVDAILAVSRALGDGSYKNNPDLPADKQKVSPVPDYFETRVGPDDFLFICCDGIFETFTNEQAISYITEGLKEGSDSAAILGNMLHSILRGGSKDNMTSMIIEFKDGCNYHLGDEFVVGEWYEGGNESYKIAFSNNCELYGQEEAEVIRRWTNLSEEAKRQPLQISQSKSMSSPELIVRKAPSKKRSKDLKEKGEKGDKGDRDRKLSSSAGGAAKPSKHKKSPSSPEVRKKESPSPPSLSDYVKRYNGLTAKHAIIDVSGITLTEVPTSPKK